MGIGQGQQQGVRGQEAIAEATPGVAGHFQKMPEGCADLGLGAAHGPGQLGEEAFAGVHQALNGFGPQSRPLQQGMQAGLGPEQGHEEVLGHQLRVLVPAGSLLGGYQGVIGFLGEGKEGHGAPRIPSWFKCD